MTNQSALMTGITGQGGAYLIELPGRRHALQYTIHGLTRITGQQIQLELSPAFVRANEVHRLCGSPAKLQSRLVAHGAKRHNPPPEDTLRRMLNAIHGVPV